METNTPRKKVAIIGGGTGMINAWLLSDQFDVTLYEMSDRLGGHIQSVELTQSDSKKVVIEAGTEFINSEQYKNFYILLKLLGLELLSYTIKMEFIDYTKKDSVANFEKTLFSPGITDLANNYSDVGKKCCTEGCFSGIKEFNEDSEKLENLMLLQYALLQYNKRKNKFTSETTKEFIDSLNLPNKKFGPEFFYPFTNASWGIDSTNTEGTEPRNAEDFLAFYTFYYIAAGNTYQEVVGGLSKYIDALFEQIKHICNIKKKSEVLHISESSSKNKYKVLYKNLLTNEIITDDNYDEIIICTSFEIASRLLYQMPNMEDINKKIGAVTYYTTKICLHESKDKDFDENFVVHIKRTSPSRSTLHITKPWNSNLTRSWVFIDEKDPENTLKTMYYRHPNMTKTYYIAQEAEKEHNKKMSGISFGGIGAGFNDSHESAMEVALQIAKNLEKKYGYELLNLKYFNKKEKTYCTSCCIM